VGYPLVTLLVCLVEQEQYAKQMDIMADFLVKQMKVKEYRCWSNPRNPHAIRSAHAPAAPRPASQIAERNYLSRAPYDPSNLLCSAQVCLHPAGLSASDASASS
jgi:hypothetical protein